MLSIRGYWRRRGLRRVLMVLSVLAAAGGLPAAELMVHVDDGRQPLTAAVISLHSTGAAAAVKPRNARMDQRDSQFVPRLLLVQAGSEVSFPNSDNVRHHIYSFSREAVRAAAIQR